MGVKVIGSNNDNNSNNNNNFNSIILQLKIIVESEICFRILRDLNLNRYICLYTAQRMIYKKKCLKLIGYQYGLNCAKLEANYF